MKAKLLLPVAFLLLSGCKAPAPTPSPTREPQASRGAPSDFGYGDEQERAGGHRRSRHHRHEGSEPQAGGQDTQAGVPQDLPQAQNQAGQQLTPRAKRGRAEREAVPGQFDFYLLNLSWSPEFCATHGTSPECGKGTGFVVHGLWPQDFTGDYPEDCSDAPGPKNPTVDTDIFPTASLVTHEWQTHGTCSGLAADAYFLLVHQAFAEVHIPQNIASSGVAPSVAAAVHASLRPTLPYRLQALRLAAETTS